MLELALNGLEFAYFLFNSIVWFSRIFWFANY